MIYDKEKEFDKIKKELDYHWGHFNKLMDKFKNTEFINKAPKEIVLKEFGKIKDVYAEISCRIDRLEFLVK